MRQILIIALLLIPAVVMKSEVVPIAPNANLPAAALGKAVWESMASLGFITGSAVQVIDREPPPFEKLAKSIRFQTPIADFSVPTDVERLSFQIQGESDATLRIRGDSGERLIHLRDQPLQNRPPSADGAIWLTFSMHQGAVHIRLNTNEDQVELTLSEAGGSGLGVISIDYPGGDDQEGMSIGRRAPNDVWIWRFFRQTHMKWLLDELVKSGYNRQVLEILGDQVDKELSALSDEKAYIQALNISKTELVNITDLRTAIRMGRLAQLQRYTHTQDQTATRYRIGTRTIYMFTGDSGGELGLQKSGRIQVFDETGHSLLGAFFYGFKEQDILRTFQQAEIVVK